MPEIEFRWVGINQLDTELWEITVEIENIKIIPTRLALAANKNIGLPDLLTLDGVDVVLAGTVSDRFDLTISPAEHRPSMLFIENGIPGESVRTFRFLVQGQEGELVTLGYDAEKARDIDLEFRLHQSVITPNSP